MTRDCLGCPRLLATWAWKEAISNPSVIVKAGMSDQRRTSADPGSSNQGLPLAQFAKQLGPPRASPPVCRLRARGATGGLSTRVPWVPQVARNLGLEEAFSHPSEMKRLA